MACALPCAAIDAWRAVARGRFAVRPSFAEGRRWILPLEPNALLPALPCECARGARGSNRTRPAGEFFSALQFGSDHGRQPPPEGIQCRRGPP